MTNEDFTRVVNALVNIGVPTEQASALATPMTALGAFEDWFVSIPESGAYIQVYGCLTDPDGELVDIHLETRTYTDVNEDIPVPAAMGPTHLWFPDGDTVMPAHDTLPRDSELVETITVDEFFARL